MKKIMFSTLVAAASLFAVAQQAHAGTTLDAIKKKALFSAVSAMVYRASLMPMLTANSPVLMSISVGLRRRRCLAMPARSNIPR
jgi:hypothetical protein